MWGKKETITADKQLRSIAVKDILPNPDQPRRQFPMDKLLMLAQSISENGILNPLSVTIRDGRPVLVAGERRLRAAKIVGLKMVPCIVMDSSASQNAVLSLLENLQREDMNPFEEAAGIKRLMFLYGMTQEVIAKKLGWAQSTVANKLRLLKLPESQQMMMIEAGLTERHARALLRLADDEVRLAALRRVISNEMTVGQTEQMIAEIVEGASRPKTKPAPMVRDVRLFINTVNHAVNTMCRSGIPAKAEKKETADYIEYVVRISKTAAARTEKSTA